MLFIELFGVFAPICSYMEEKNISAGSTNFLPGELWKIIVEKMLILQRKCFLLRVL